MNHILNDNAILSVWLLYIKPMLIKSIPHTFRRTISINRQILRACTSSLITILFGSENWPHLHIVPDSQHSKITELFLLCVCLTIGSRNTRSKGINKAQDVSRLNALASPAERSDQ